MSIIPKPPIHYCIRPNPNLLNKVESKEWDCLFNEPLLISRVEGDNIRIRGKDWKRLRLVQVKTAFLASLVSDYVLEYTEDGGEFRELIVEITGYPSVSEEAFDKWWTLERIENFYATFEELEREIEEEGIGTSIASTVDGMSEWLKGIGGTE